MRDLTDIQLAQDTNMLYRGSMVNGDTLHPEAPPLYATTAFMMDDLYKQFEVNQTRGYNYIRGTNPTRDALGELISCSECGEWSLLFSSGMGAIYSTIITFAKSGDHVVANSDLYGETFDLLANLLGKSGVETTFVSFSDLDALRAARKPNTTLFYSEVISNPLTNLVDVRAVADIAHETGALYCVDSTFSTPYVIQPLRHGADLVIHSLTKYFNGHSDACGGSVTGRRELLEQIRRVMLLVGSSLDPYSSWVILRGARTMGMRLRKQNENAAQLAAFLDAHPKVEKVYHPSLPAHPQHALAKETFLNGYYGAIVTFSIQCGIDEINLFMRRLKLVTYLPSLGGYRTTLSHPVSSSHHDVPESIRLKMGIHDGMLRISVGCEDIQDLIQDFRTALESM